jgi:hypothetical protein
MIGWFFFYLSKKADAEKREKTNKQTQKIDGKFDE